MDWSTEMFSFVFQFFDYSRQTKLNVNVESEWKVTLKLILYMFLGFSTARVIYFNLLATGLMQWESSVSYNDGGPL